MEYSTKEITNLFTTNRLFPVIYVDKLPEFELPNGKKWLERCDFICAHKLSDWSYEEEWRLMPNMNFLPNVTPGNISKFEEYGVTVEFIKPSKIYLGFNIDPKEEKIIRQVGECENITVSKMTCSLFGLSFEE